MSRNRNRFLLGVVFAFACAVPLGATYNAASVVSKSTDEASGLLHVIVEATGDAGEPAIDKDFYLDGSVTDLPTLRGLVIAWVNQLNGRASLNTNIPLGTISLTPIVPTVVGAARYVATALPITPGATPQDVCTLTGSATKTVTVSRVTLTTSQTTAGVNVWNILKRSTANTGGTASTATAMPVDTLSPAATATARGYTANPTAGTLVGRYAVRHVASPAAATAGADNAPMVIDLNVVLRGVNEVLALNFNGATLPAGLSVACAFEWSEQ